MKTYLNLAWTNTYQDLCDSEVQNSGRETLDRVRCMAVLQYMCQPDTDTGIVNDSSNSSIGHCS